LKVAWVSNVFPPSHTSHAAVIHRLLGDRDPETYCLISGRDYVSEMANEWSERLPGRYYHLRSVRLTRGYRLGLRTVRIHLNHLFDIQRVFLIARILRRERCDAIVACTGGDEIADFPAAYLASRIVGIPFYAYLLDQFSHMVNYGMGTSILRHLEPMMMKGAAGVIVPNEFLADDVRRQFGVEPVVIHNPIDLALYEHARQDRPSDECNIVYTGEVGLLHFSAFRNLVAAIKMLDFPAKLHLYTVRPPELLETDGIKGPVVVHGQRPLQEMPAVQSNADILFLPLALDCEHPNIVRTAAPGKMAEYLAAKRPILVHAPPDSFLAWYLQHHQCGLVVDRDDPAALAEAIRRLASDADLRRSISERARERAMADFAIEKSRAQLDRLLGW
jgi:glycosyltransferase involved in cell wall biosynthesis